MSADDHDAIARLVFAYAEGVDRGDFAAVAHLFAAATWRATLGTDVMVFTGEDEVQRCFERTVQLHEDGTPSTKHVTTNLVIQADEVMGRGTARSYFTVLQARPGLPLQTIVAGRYDDTFERFNGVWRFADRLILTDLVGDVSQHLKGVRL